MFLQYFGIREQPFGVTPNPRFLYHSPSHREALASLIYGIEADLGFAALIAEPGMGKTTLLFYLLEKFRSSARTALVFQTQCGPVELLRYVANELEVDSSEDDPVVLNDRIREVLVEEARARRRVLIIIDEAQNLTEEALETIRLLSDFETPDFKLLHIVLAGQPQLAQKLARPSMAQLLQRIAMLNRLLPFNNAEDVSHYLAYRLKVAGYAGPPLFAPDAIQLIAKHSGGVPRQINRICFNALSIGCALKKRRIDAEIIQEVLSDLDVASLLSQPVAEDPEPPVEYRPRRQGRIMEGRAAVDDLDDGLDDEFSRGAPEFQREMETVRPISVRQTAQTTAASATAPTMRAQARTEGALAFSRAPETREEEAQAPRARTTVPPKPRFAPEPRPRFTSQAPPRPKLAAKVTRPAPASRVVAGKDRNASAAPDHRNAMAMIVFWAVAVPLLLVAAWFFLEKQNMLPGFAQPATPTVQENAPAGDAATTDDNSQPGKSVDLPSDNNAKTAKPKKPGKRSQAIPLILPMSQQVSG